MANGNKIKTEDIDFSSSLTWSASNFLRGDGSWQPIVPSGLTSIPIDRTVFVSKNGNDGTGLPGRLDRPFLTIPAARIAASTLSPATYNRVLIHVFTGEYLNEPFTLGSGIDYYFQDSVIRSTNVGAMISDSGASDSTIYGTATFVTTSDHVIGLTNSLSVVTLNCSQIIALPLGGPSISRLVLLSRGKLTINADKIILNKSYFIVNSDFDKTYLFVNANYLEAYDQSGVYSSAGSTFDSLVFLNIKNIISPTAITNPDHCFKINVSTGSVNTNIYISNCRIWWGNTILSINGAGLSPKIIFTNCRLIGRSSNIAFNLVRVTPAISVTNIYLLFQYCQITDITSDFIDCIDLILNSASDIKLGFSRSTISTLNRAGEFTIQSNIAINVICFSELTCSAQTSNITALGGSINVNAVYSDFNTIENYSY